MKKILAALLAVICCIGGLSAKSLEKFMVRGYVRGPEWNSIDSVKINVSRTDSVPVKFRLLSGNNDERLILGGELRLMIEGGLGTYNLDFDKEGYIPFTHELKIASISQDVNYIPTVHLDKEYVRQLNEVTVTHTAIKMVMKGDTIVYDAAAFQLAEGSMLEQLVKMLPGAQLNDGQIRVNGKLINELLVDGKDFFSGDPKIALKNLPAYTVKNIKVYDKAAEDAYLTRSDQRINDKDDEKNMVMDVVLKKEYAKGFMGNVEGGYGTADRYLGKLFGLGFTDKLRLSFFANCNNLNVTDQVDDDGDWYYSGDTWMPTGVADIQKGGLDYLYDNKKTRISGDVNVTRADETNLNSVAKTSYFDSGDLYARSATNQRTLNFNLATNHRLIWKGEHMQLTIRPTYKWDHKNDRTLRRSATFTENPVDQTRDEALDSVFRSARANAYTDILLNRLGLGSREESDAHNATLNVNLTFRPESSKSIWYFNAYGDYSGSELKARRDYVQTYGPQSTDATPSESRRYNPVKTDRGGGEFTLTYSHETRTFGERFSNSFNVNAALRYGIRRDKDNYETFIAQLTDPDGFGGTSLPVLTNPEHALIDAENSYYSTTRENKLRPTVRLSWGRETIEQTDSGINPGFGADFGLEGLYLNEHLDYNRPHTLDTLLTRNSFTVRPTFSAYFNSNNRQRYLTAQINGELNQTMPQLTYFLPTRPSADPTAVYLGAQGLKRSNVYSVNAYFYRSEKKNSRYVSVSLRYNRTDNKVSMGSYYNRETGVTTFVPMNINGNWNAHFRLFWNADLDREKKLSFYGHSNIRYDNNVDYMTTGTRLEKSLVRAIGANLNPTLNYQIYKKYYLTLIGRFNWNHAESPVESFNTVSAFEYGGGLGIDFTLPLEIRLASRLQLMKRTGYSDSSLNTEMWHWNASIYRSFLKNGALTLSLKAEDILNQLSEVTMFINAQGRTETWQNRLPRYVMLTATYRFNHNPRNVKKLR